MLSSCAALQKPAQEPARYRVTLAVGPGSNEAEMTAALANIPVNGMDFHTVSPGLGGFGPYGEQRIFQLTLPGEQAVQQLQQQLQAAGIPVINYHIEKLN